MRKSIALVVIGLAAGLVIAAWWGGDSLAPSPDSSDAAATLQRLDALEEQLAAEVRRRGDIEAELAVLHERLAPVAVGDDEVAVDSIDSRSDGPETREETTVAEARVPPFARGRPPFERDDDEIVERFIAAGLSSERAQWIIARSEELRMQALQEQYDAAREGRPPDPTFAGFSPQSTLREELGDADYERYLQALDRPTNVYVRDVLATSPGAAAGIKAGDQVVAFDGERVFDMGDINRLVLKGEPGQVVALDVLRDGQLVQLYVPRGPIGITGGRVGPPFR